MNLFDLKKGWEWTNLEGVASSEKNAIVDGPFGSSMKTSDYVESGVPVLQGKNVTNNQFRWFDVRYISDKKAVELQRSKVRVGDILMVKIGSIGYSAIVDDLQGHQFAIIPANLAKVTVNSSRIDKKYLQYWLTSPSIKEYLVSSASKTAQPALSLSKIKNTPVPLPPLPEQKRIAAILDKADSIRRKRQEAVRLTEELLRSVFLDMFGDPVTNPKGWVNKQLDALCTKITDGEHLNPTFVDDGYPIVMANNVRSEGVIFDGVKYVSKEDFKKFTKKCRPERNDILVVSRGATIGRCTVVNTDLPFCLMGSTILLKTDNKVVLPAFLNWLLQHPAYQAKLYKTSSSSAQQAIYLSHIKGLSIPIPPITDQQKFSDLVIKGKKASNFYSKSVIQNDTLFNSLLQRAFKGGL